MFDLIEKYKNINTPILIQGSVGTGKSYLAKAIHDMSIRKHERFITVNCDALSETLIESELFGHEKGAFVSAACRKLGAVQLADNGTLFLRHVEFLPNSVQIKLVKLLKEKCFSPMGVNKSIEVNARVIMSTRENASSLVKNHTIREDLYYFFKMNIITLSNLRTNPKLLKELTGFFIEKFNYKYSKSIHGIDARALELFYTYAWHGNILELENLLEHLVLIESENRIKVNSLPDYIKELYL